MNARVAREPRRVPLAPSYALVWIALTVMALATTAHANGAACRPTLERAMLEATTPAGQATALVRAAFTALEPAYPSLRDPTEWDDPNAAWLDARGLLPATWNEDALDLDAWRALLATLQAPYGTETLATSGDLDAEALLTDVETVLTRAAAAVRPLALIATDDEDENRVAFAAVIWNWTPIPRLLLFPLRGESLENGRATQELLARIGTCAWTASDWMAAREGQVAEYYLSGAGAGVELLARGEETVREAIAEDAVLGTFRLATPTLTGVDVASIRFIGPGPSFRQVIGLLFSLRSNVTVLDLPYYLTIP